LWLGHRTMNESRSAGASMNESISSAVYTGAALLDALLAIVPRLRTNEWKYEQAVLGCKFFVNSLNSCRGRTL
jgi:hypothetical protein